MVVPFPLQSGEAVAAAVPPTEVGLTVSVTVLLVAGDPQAPVTMTLYDFPFKEYDGLVIVNVLPVTPLYGATFVSGVKPSTYH